MTGPAGVNDPQVLYEWVCAHRGIALVPDWVVGEGIPSGRVQWLLPDFYPLSQPVHIVTPQTRFISRRARSFIDFFTAKMRGGWLRTHLFFLLPGEKSQTAPIQSSIRAPTFPFGRSHIPNWTLLDSQLDDTL